MGSMYTPEQLDRWYRPTLVRTAGRGGAVHIQHPDTGEPFCGRTAARTLTESELSSRAPWCRECRIGHDMLHGREQRRAYWAARPKQPDPRAERWDRERVAAGLEPIYQT